MGGRDKRIPQKFTGQLEWNIQCRGKQEAMPQKQAVKQEKQVRLSSYLHVGGMHTHTQTHTHYVYTHTLRIHTHIYVFIYIK